MPSLNDEQLNVIYDPYNILQNLSCCNFHQGATAVASGFEFDFESIAEGEEGIEFSDNPLLLGVHSETRTTAWNLGDFTSKVGAVF
ncbi:hypothetical protein C7B82_04460 [Stenomitos frigidus ULC18]|uniref:Uncharacterized protein n=1 Tax=Stenomitos frigidus ULC18 TaxID=2107698 RepID=A0A2T1ELZ8_9CYAN|nr:hypothetical protein C7B82_04460 [Stenomitos frigidus ULC18]